jgi:ketosteroid isomerase-like protein
MSRENIEVVKSAIAAYNRRDFDAIREVSQPDVQLDWSASRGLEAGIYRGQDETIRFYEEFLGTFEEVDVEPEHFIESGDSVIVPNTTRVHGRDGIETVARSAFVFEVRDGLIARVRLYQETEEALETVRRKD